MSSTDEESLEAGINNVEIPRMRRRLARLTRWFWFWLALLVAMIAWMVAVLLLPASNKPNDRSIPYSLCILPILAPILAIFGLLPAMSWRRDCRRSLQAATFADERGWKYLDIPTAEECEPARRFRILGDLPRDWVGRFMACDFRGMPAMTFNFFWRDMRFTKYETEFLATVALLERAVPGCPNLALLYGSNVSTFMNRTISGRLNTREMPLVRVNKRFDSEYRVHARHEDVPFVFTKEVRQFFYDNAPITLEVFGENLILFRPDGKVVQEGGLEELMGLAATVADLLRNSVARLDAMDAEDAADE